MTQALTRTRWYLAGLLVVAVIGTLASNATASEPAGWVTDTAHTEINFSIKHFFTPVSGNFSDFEIDLDYNAEEPEKSTVEARIKVASINTGNERRDNHLRTADWFEVDTYPDMTFKSTSVRKVAENQLIASGPLTIKGQSKEIELAITLLGTQAIPEEMRQMFGGTQEVASFQASTAIDRGDFGVGVGNWAATMVVGGKVKIEILLEAHNK
ncbi:MAG: YceI family protein [Acidobacteriota bacterium]|nr:YceI family protein [Acidobacteriota bacterium]